MKKTLVGLLFLGLLAVAIFHVFNIYKKNKLSSVRGVVKIGYMGPLSGEDSSIGFSALKGVQLAKKELSADDFEIVIEDTGCDSKKAAKGIKNLIDKGVVAVIGELCSSASLAALEVANQYKIPMISPGSTSPRLSTPDDYFFRTIPPDSLQSKFAADLIYRRGLRKLAIVYTKDAYGMPFQEELSKEFVKLGGKVVSSVGVEMEKLNITSQINEMKETKPDSIFVVLTTTPSIVASLKQIRSQKMTQPIFCSESLNDSVVINDAGEAVEGVIITSVSSGTKQFKQAHRAEFGVEAGGYSSQAYDAFKTLYLALQNELVSGDQLNKIIYKTKFEGRSGVIVFDKNGEVAGNYEPLVVKNNKVVPLSE